MISANYRIKVGDEIPPFVLENQNGKKIDIQSYIGRPLVLFFYPKDNTPGCTAESCNLNDNYDAWLEKGFDGYRLDYKKTVLKDEKLDIEYIPKPRVY